MKPSPFDYSRAGSLEDALQLLAGDDNSRILAGGQSLLPLMNLRLARPSRLIDIGDLIDLAGVAEEHGHLLIGSMTRHRELETNEKVRQRVPLLQAGVREIGHIAIRNRGTVGGSLAHADPAAELPLLMVVLGASIILESLARGRREVDAQDFFVSMFTTSLAPDEVLTHVRIPASKPGEGWGFHEYARRPGDFALAGAAALVEVNTEGIVTSAQAGVLGIADVPILVSDLTEPRDDRRPIRDHWEGVVSRSTDSLEAQGTNADYLLAIARSALVDSLVDAESRAQSAWGHLEKP